MPTPSDVTIFAEGVEKRFGDSVALASLDLSVRRGECVGLLGPNGAGKSTFIGCLYGAVERSGGRLTVFGDDPAKFPRRIKERLGVVPQENALDEELTVEQNLRLYARFVGLPKTQTAARIAELLTAFSLAHKADARIRMLSGGMKRRLAFVRALLGDPELLILDEPTTGLDPAVRHVLWDRVDAFRAAHKTVLVTTHYMHEAESLCDRVIILDRGQVVATGSPAELIEQHTPGYIGLFPADGAGPLRPHLQADWAAYEQGRMFFVRAPSLDALAALQAASGVKALQMRPSNLEDVYLQLTGQELGADE